MSIKVEEMQEISMTQLVHNLPVAVLWNSDLVEIYVFRSV